jgi:hypothetical protein
VAAELRERYRALLTRAAADPNVAGVILAGSRAVPAFATAHSDYDVWLVLVEPDDASWPFVRGSGIEMVTTTIEAFRDHAAVGSASYWNRSSFIDARLELDKRGGEIVALLDAKRRLSSAEADRLVPIALDDYINNVYRSLKNFRDGRPEAGRLDGRDTIPPLLTTVFALAERVRPFNKWLARDLEREPLPIHDFHRRVMRISDAADPSDQRAMFRDVEGLARARGNGGLFDGWGPDVPFLRGG